MQQVKAANIQKKKTVDGSITYWWVVPTKARKAGCPLATEKLGKDEQSALSRATMLNDMLNEWRKGRLAAEKANGPVDGSVNALVKKFYTDPVFKNKAPGTRKWYVENLDASLALLPTDTARLTFGRASAKTVKPRHADSFYKVALMGKARDPSAMHLGRGEAMVKALKHVWNTQLKGQPNPWETVTIIKNKKKARPYTRFYYNQFVKTCIEEGDTGMALAAFLAFEFAQRAGDVRTFTWEECFRENENVFYIAQKKTGYDLRIPLIKPGTDQETFPGLIKLLQSIPRTNKYIITTKSTGTPYSSRHLNTIYRNLARKADIPRDLHFKCFRHGAMTEMADAGATSQEMMSLSGHLTTAMVDVYTSKSTTQTMNAIEKRRIFGWSEDAVKEIIASYERGEVVQE